MTLGLINANPVVQAKKERITRKEDEYRDGGGGVDPLEIYDHVRDIRDSEHPYSLEQLSVVSEDSITVDDKLDRVLITFTPTIQHCSMATIIGLCLRAKLKECLPLHYKVIHAFKKLFTPSMVEQTSYRYLCVILILIFWLISECLLALTLMNFQLNDKERVVAALENSNLRQLVDECISSNDM